MAEFASEKKYTAGEATALVIIAPILATAVVAATFPITIYCAWVDMHLWNWFAAPYLHLQPMALWLAVGIGMWIRLQTMDSKIVKGQEIRVFLGLITSVSVHTITLGIGYLIHLKGLA